MDPLQALRVDGVVPLPPLSSSTIDELNVLSQQVYDQIIAALDEKKLSHPIGSLYFDAIERAKGRYELVPNKAVMAQMWTILDNDPTFRKYQDMIYQAMKGRDRIVRRLGTIPAEPASSHGSWHRDVWIENQTVSFFDEVPYYCNLLIPLAHQECAPTQFIKGSHKYLDGIDEATVPDDHPDLLSCPEMGTILFDGRIVHRGSKNNGSKVRHAIYMEFYDPEYEDQENDLPYLLDP